MSPRITLAGLAALLCSQAQAQSGEWLDQGYIGLRGGFSLAAQNSAKLTADLQARGHAVQATVDDTDFGGTLYAGWFLAPPLAVELGLSHFGHYDTTVSGLSPNPAQLAADVATLQPVSGEAVSLAARGQFALARNLWFTPRAGGFYVYRKTEIQIGGVSADANLRHFGWLAGAGLDLGLDDHWHLGLSWDYFKTHEHRNLQQMGASLEYHFGHYAAAPVMASVPPPSPPPPPPAPPPPPPVIVEPPPVIVPPPSPPPVAVTPPVTLYEAEIHFAHQAAQMGPEGRAEFEHITQQLLKMQAQSPKFRLQLVGHADGDGNDAANLKLSEQRAQTVDKALMERGIKQQRIHLDAKGNAAPEVPPNSDAARARNRRVTVRAVAPE